MYLFVRSARLGPGRLAEAMTWAVNVTEKVNQISETPVSLWSTVLSPRVGTLSWTTVVEDLEVLEATDAKLMADNGYLQLVNEGATFASGDAIDDGLAQLVVADLDSSGTPPAYVSVVQSALAPGAMASGIELGVEICQKVKKITACPCSFGVASTGPYGGVLWFTGFASMAELQRSEEALNGDADFVELIDAKASKAYVVGVTTQAIHRRIV